MKYVLDTSALLAYYQDEPGADMVEQLLNKAEAGEVEIYLSFMSIFEVAYVATAREGIEEAVKLVIQVRELPLKEVWPDEELMWEAAKIKAMGGLSVADSFITAVASLKKAILVHRDPELDKSELKIERIKLPEKTGSEANPSPQP
ncbi:type II toxin-antitoxin system VapC family toxin [Moorellaceae bacterium AZ2]